MNMRETRRASNRAFLIFLVIAAVYLLIGVYQAHAEEQDPTVTSSTKPIAYVVHFDTGGTISEYISRSKIMQGSKVIVDGPCLSACPMLLSTEYNLDVCVTDRALFGFHKPYKTNPSDGKPFILASIEPEIEELWETYFLSVMPGPIKDWLETRYVPSVTAGDPGSLFLIYVGGDLPACENTWQEDYQLRMFED
jgi:hypothetical protein